MIRVPMDAECAAQARIQDIDGRPAYAGYYPQMGGYHSKCVVVPGRDCFDVYVWHDGEFPFNEDDDPMRQPARLHHCNWRQFIEFGEWVGSISQS